MTKSFDKLNDTFNISSVEVDVVDTPKDIVATSTSKISRENPQKTKNDIEKDYEYTRTNIYSIIEKGQEAINGVLELAQETESPRAYEVVGQLIKNVSDATDKLIDLQKKLKDLDENNVKQSTNITNALFVGSTAELSKFLKSQREETKS